MVMRIGKVSSLTVVAALSLLMGTASPASALDSREISGYSKEEYVAAAAANGVLPEYALSAWGNRELMAMIPVESGERSSQPPGTGRAVTYTAWCEKWAKNDFGGYLYRYRMTKSWRVSGGAITNPVVVPSYETGWGWYFNGVTDSQDVFAGRDHLSYRSVKFSNDIPGPIGASAWVQIISYPSADFDCSYGG